MEVGDLVHLSPIYFYEFDECHGIIIEASTDGENKIYKVIWTDDSNGQETGWFHEEELEVVSENRRFGKD